MPNCICITCGVPHAESLPPPQRCAICEDGRQYVGWEGQKWTTHTDLQSIKAFGWASKGQYGRSSPCSNLMSLSRSWRMVRAEHHEGRQAGFSVFGRAVFGRDQ